MTGTTRRREGGGTALGRLYLAGVLLIAALLRFPLLSSIPNGFYQDEAITGYDSYSILKTLRDQYGEFLPVFAQSFGSYNEALYRYLTVPFIALLGLDELSVRLPAAVVGVLTVLALFRLVEAYSQPAPRTAVKARGCQVDAAAVHPVCAYPQASLRVARRTCQGCSGDTVFRGVRGTARSGHPSWSRRVEAPGVRGVEVASSTDSDKLLQQVVDALVRAVDPEEVILFGSRARGDDTGESDIDLFLQVATGRDTRQLAKESYKTIHRLKERPLVGIDVVVKDTAFVERFGDCVGSVVRPVLTEGRLLYARRPSP